MKKVKKYLGTETYMYPGGKLATPDVVLQDFSAATTYPHIVILDENEEVILSLANLSLARMKYKIDSSLSEDEAISAIETIINTPQPTPETVASPEERIAAALEYQNMMSL